VSDPQRIRLLPCWVNYRHELVFLDILLAILSEIGSMRNILKTFIVFLATLSFTFASVTLECPGELTDVQEVRWLRNGVEITKEIGTVNSREAD
jgi:hypothetical protein